MKIILKYDDVIGAWTLTTSIHPNMTGTYLNPYQAFYYFMDEIYKYVPDSICLKKKITISISMPKNKVSIEKGNF